MTTTTTSVLAGSRSHATLAPAGSIVNIAPGSGGTMMLEYSLSSAADLRNGVAVWNTWPGGTVSASTQNKANKNMYVRAWAYTAAGSVTINDDPTPADLAAYVPDWGTDQIFQLSSAPSNNDGRPDGAVVVVAP